MNLKLTIKYNRGSTGKELVGPLTSNFFSSGKDIHQRNSEWEQHKTKKIQFYKEKNANKDLVGCTFTPEINRSRPQSAEAIHSIAGYREYMERKEKARKQKEEQERLSQSVAGIYYYQIQI